MANGKKRSNKQNGTKKIFKKNSKSKSTVILDNISDLPNESKVTASLDCSLSSITSTFSCCIPGCNYDGQKGDAELFRCCTCMRWVHLVCCGDQESDSNYVGIYNCSICRTISDRVLNIENQLKISQDLNKNLINLIEKSNEECEKLRKLLSNLVHHGQLFPKTKNCWTMTTDTLPHDLEPVIRTLGTATTSVVQETSKKSVMPKQPLNPDAPPFWSVSPKYSGISGRTAIVPTASSPQQEVIRVSKSPKNQQLGSKIIQQPTSAQPIKTVSQLNQKDLEEPTTSPTEQTSRKPKLSIIGTSMVRDTGKFIAPAIPSMDTCVYSQSGLSIGKAKYLVPKIVKDYRSTDSVVLNIGTADVMHKDHLEIASDYSVLIDKVKTVAPQCNIYISAVPHRLGDDGELVNDNIDCVNKSLKLLCARDAICKFINVNPAATYKYYKRDNLHFNYEGSKTFANTLTEKIKHTSNFPLARNHTHV